MLLTSAPSIKFARTAKICHSYQPSYLMDKILQTSSIGCSYCQFTKYYDITYCVAGVSCCKIENKIKELLRLGFTTIQKKHITFRKQKNAERTDTKALHLSFFIIYKKNSLLLTRECLKIAKSKRMICAFTRIFLIIAHITMAASSHFLYRCTEWVWD